MPDLSRSEVSEEESLLVDAVSLLVQRQRETESWVAEQVLQAEERAAATERRYAELEARLASIEEHVSRLAQDVEPARRADPAVDERLERLREQVEGLRSGSDRHPQRSAAATPIESRLTFEPATPAFRPATLTNHEPPGREVGPPAGAPPESRRSATRLGSHVGRPSAARPSTQSIGVWNLLGSTPQDRVGFVLIGVGLLAVLYAILSQLRIG